MIAAVLCSGISWNALVSSMPSSLLRRQDLEELRVILEIGARAVAPRVALALTGRHAEVVAHLAMHPLGDGFGGFDRDAVDVERFGVLAGVLQRLEALRRLVADGHDLERRRRRRRVDSIERK